MAGQCREHRARTAQTEGQQMSIREGNRERDMANNGEDWPIVSPEKANKKIKKKRKGRNQ